MFTHTHLHSLLDSSCSSSVLQVVSRIYTVHAAGLPPSSCMNMMWHPENTEFCTYSQYVLTGAEWWSVGGAASTSQLESLHLNLDGVRDTARSNDDAEHGENPVRSVRAWLHSGSEAGSEVLPPLLSFVSVLF